MTEAEIKADILRAIGSRPDVRLWNNPSGVARTLDGNRTVRFGLPGQADLSGILRDGRRLEIEVKSATGKQSDEQRAFAAMIEKYNGVYILARSVADAVDGVAGAYGSSGAGSVGT